jgi:thioredoxin reductase
VTTLLLTKDMGGQAALTPHIENYPGFDTITGQELMEKFQQQATKFGTEFRYEEVKRIGQTVEVMDLMVVITLIAMTTWLNVKTSTDDLKVEFVIG